jgi:hypothetical protein
VEGVVGVEEGVGEVVVDVDAVGRERETHQYAWWICVF